MPIGEGYVVRARGAIGNFLRFNPDLKIGVHLLAKKAHYKAPWMTKPHSVCFHGKTVREIFKPDFKGQEHPSTAVEFDKNEVSEHVVQTLAAYLEFRDQNKSMPMSTGLEFTKHHIITSLTAYEKMHAQEEQQAALGDSLLNKRLRYKESSPESSDLEITSPPPPKKKKELRAAHV